jgi:hypothetical protein
LQREKNEDLIKKLQKDISACKVIEDIYNGKVKESLSTVEPEFRFEDILREEIILDDTSKARKKWKKEKEEMNSIIAKEKSRLKILGKYGTIIDPDSTRRATLIINNEGKCRGQRYTEIKGRPYLDRVWLKEYVDEWIKFDGGDEYGMYGSRKHPRDGIRWALCDSRVFLTDEEILWLQYRLREDLDPDGWYPSPPPSAKDETPDKKRYREYLDILINARGFLSYDDPGISAWVRENTQYVYIKFNDDELESSAMNFDGTPARPDLYNKTDPSFEAGLEKISGKKKTGD